MLQNVNVNNVNELKNLLTDENIKKYRYIEFTVKNNDENYLSVFYSKFNNPYQKLTCCDVICDDEIINNYYYMSLDDLISRIVEEFEL